MSEISINIKHQKTMFDIQSWMVYFMPSLTVLLHLNYL